MADTLSELEYGRILGSFTAIAEDAEGSEAPDALPLSGSITFTPSVSHVTYVNYNGETANLYVSPKTASVVDGNIVDHDGTKGVVLLASDGDNVSSSVLWTADIVLTSGLRGIQDPAPHKFLIEVKRNTISSIVDVIKGNPRVHNIALFNDALAEAVEAFWERVESGEFRGKEGPQGPPGEGRPGLPGPIGQGIDGHDGAPGLGGNIIPDGDFEVPGFLLSGDFSEVSDSLSGVVGMLLTGATSRRINLTPGKNYSGSFFAKSVNTATIDLSVRYFTHSGVIIKSESDQYSVGGGEWQEFDFSVDTEDVLNTSSIDITVGTRSIPLVFDLFSLADSSPITDIDRTIEDLRNHLAAKMEQLELEMDEVDTRRAELNESLNDLVIVMESADVDLTEVNNQLEDLREDLEKEQTNREEADEAGQLIIQQLDKLLDQARNDLAANTIIMDNLETELVTAKEELDVVAGNIETLETVTLPKLRTDLQETATAVANTVTELNDKLYGANGDIAQAKDRIDQLATEITEEAQARNQLALDLAQDFAERDDRLQSAEEKLATAFPEGVFDVSSELSRTIRNTVPQYAVTSSETVAPTSGWSATAPIRTPGQFIWYRTVITYADDTTSTTSAVLLTGNTGQEGPQGVPGEDGTGVRILGSLDSTEDLPASGDAGDAYLVQGYMYVWAGDGWTNAGLIQGPQGVQGPPGDDGAPTYTWVKYADSAMGVGISDDPTNKSYLGLSYNNTTPAESENPTDYQWSLFKGPQGSQGVAGAKGDDGTTLYTWLKYADTPTTGMSDFPTSKAYIGLAYNKVSPDESSDYSDYSWALIKGPKGDTGVAGGTGPKGDPLYTWVKYADSATGSGIADSPVGKAYIGLAPNKTTSAESSNPGDYQWALIQGPQGEKGSQGIAGEAGPTGQSLYTWIKYADTPTTGMSDAPEGKKYIGLAYNKISSNESSTYADYTWSLAVGPEGPQGETGTAGPPGDDGSPRYTWIKYSNSVSGSGMTDDPAGKAYIGIAYNKISPTPSTVATDYTWALFRGPQGDPGSQGATGNAGPQGVGISSITPYFRDVAGGSTAPAAPTTATPSGWSTSEPTWAPNRDLYRVEKVVYTNGSFAFGTPTKVAAYAGIDAAMQAANGKNNNTYSNLPSSSKPGTAPATNSARVVGDVHRNRDQVTGEIWSEYLWNGTSWVPISFGDTILRSLDVGKITGGTGSFEQFFANNLIANNATISKLWTDQLLAKTISAQQLLIAPGNLVPDPNGLNENNRMSLGGALWVWDDTGKYWKNNQVAGSTTQFNAFLGSDDRYGAVSISPGEEYRISYDIWSGGTGTTGEARSAIYYHTTGGTTSFASDGASGTPIPANQWTRVERTWVAPSDADRGGFTFQLIYGTAPGAEVRIRNPYVGVKAGAVSIKNGAINADKINAESVGAAVGSFVKLETSQLVATNSITTPSAVIEKLWADGIAARSITASRLAISPNNLLPDPYFQEKSKWDASDTRFRIISGSTPQDNYARIVARSIQTGSYFGSVNDRPVRVEPGAQYRLRMKVRHTSPSGVPSRFGIALRMDTAGGGGSVTGNYVDLTVSTEWKEYETHILTVSDATGPANLGLFDSAPYIADNIIEVRDVVVTRMVGAVLIENGAVNAEKINAESVAAAVGSFVKVEAGNIVAGTANIDSLVAQKIAAATATFQKINAENIVATNATMSTAVIERIWADGINAKSLTTTRLAVPTRNVIPDGDRMETEEQWAPLKRNISDKPVGVMASRVSAPGSGSLSLGNTRFIVEPGQEYYAEMWIKADKPNSRFYAEIRDANTGAHAGSGTLTSPTAGSSGRYFLFAGEVVPTTWTKFTGTWTADATSYAVTLGSMYFNHSSGAERDAQISIAAPTLRPKVGAVIIENGSVSANHLTSDSVDTRHLRAEAITADKIGANQIVAGKIAANAVDTNQLRAFSVEADKIAANSIIAGKIAASAVTAREILAGTITSNEIKAGTITALEIASGAITTAKMDANSINGNRITAGTLTAEKITSGSFVGKTFSGGEFSGSSFIGGVFATSSHPSSDGGIMINASQGLRGWNSDKFQTMEISPVTGNLSMGNANDSGMVLTPRSSYGNSVIYFARGGDLGPNSAAVWRLEYDSGKNPLLLRGGNGAGITVRGEQSLFVGNLSTESDFFVGGKAYFGEYLSGYGYQKGEIRLLSDGAPQIAMQAVYDRTYSSSANVVVSSFGTLGRSTSSRRYKKNIVNWSPKAEKVLKLRPRQWQHDAPENNPEISEEWVVGFVAEEVDDLGLTGLVTYSGDGSGGWRPEGLNYDRFAAAHQVVLQKHEEDVSRLTTENTELRTRLDELEHLVRSMK